MSRTARLPGRGWRRSVSDLAALMAGLALFWWLQNRAGTDVVSATANAHSLQSVERVLHLDIEVAANQWLTRRPQLMHATVLCYRLYYLPLAAVLLWVLFRHREVFLTVRRTLVAMAAIALLVFFILPMSPPRFALTGIVDVVAEDDLFGGGASRDLTNGQNHFSAMPSLHVAWSALCAYAVWSALRGRYPRLALLAGPFPVVMVAVVISTGNHYVLDVVGSAVLLAISVAVAVGARSFASGPRSWIRRCRGRRPAGRETVTFGRSTSDGQPAADSTSEVHVVDRDAEQR